MYIIFINAALMSGYVVRQKRNCLLKASFKNKNSSLQNSDTWMFGTRKWHHKHSSTGKSRSTLFFISLWGTSQVCSLEVGCFRHCFSSTPDANPNWLKCAGNVKRIRLQVRRIGLSNCRRDGWSAMLLWLGTLPNHDMSLSLYSSLTKASVNSLVMEVAPTPCM